MKLEIFKFKKVNSTNDVAIKLIKKEKKNTGCIYAEKQTKGRGRQGKKWISQKGNLFGTIFFPLRKDYPPFNEFTVINPIIISRVIKHYCKDEIISFKWPNDVLVNKKKICGILQEIISVNSKKFLIIGIGINIISNPKISTKHEATNIYIETKKRPSIKEVIDILINSYERFFLDLKKYNYINFKKKAESMTVN
tara:strand:- start:290 stop:874 length:585 start_codon:yes stop_codon:yes gene_type:complete